MPAPRPSSAEAAEVPVAVTADAGVAGSIEAPWPRPEAARGWLPADGLAPRAVLPIEMPWCGPYAFNDVVVFCDENGLWSFSIGDAGRRAHVVSQLNAVGPQLEAGLVLGMLRGELVALDPRTLATRWQTTLITPEDAARWDGTRLREVLSDGAHLVAALRTQSSDAAEMVGLDPANGRVTWRVATQTHGDALLMTLAGSRLVLWEPQALVAIDLSSGERAWTVELPHPGDAFVTADEGHVAAEVRDGKEAHLVIVDAARGRIVRRETLTDAGYHAMALDRGQLFRARQPPGDKGSLVYEAVDVDTGRVLWTSAPVEGWMASRQLFFADVDVVFASNGHGHVNAYDRDTGALRWSWGFGMFGAPLAIARAAPGGPSVLVAGTTIFERGADVAPSFKVTFSGLVVDQGTPVAGVAVQAEGARAVTDRAGVYRISVTARGQARIVARGARGMAIKHVAVTGDGSMTVNLDVSPGCGSKCE